MVWKGFSVVGLGLLAFNCAQVAAVEFVIEAGEEVVLMQPEAFENTETSTLGGARQVRAEDNHFGIKPQDLVKSQILVIEWGNEGDISQSLLFVRPGPGPVFSGLVITRHQETKGLEYRVMHAARVFSNGHALVFDCQGMPCFGSEAANWSADSMLLDLEKRTVQTKDDIHPGGNNGNIVRQVFREGKEAAEYRHLRFLIDCILSGML